MSGISGHKKKKKNKAGYTAQDAPSMRTFHLENHAGQTDGRTDGQTDTTFYRDATADLKRGKKLKNKKTNGSRSRK